MSSQLPPMPNLVHDEWDKYSLEDLRDEMANTRRFVGQLFLQVKEWTTRLEDLFRASQDIIASRSYDTKNYIDLSNKTNELDENITLIMDFLGMSNDGEGDDDQ